MKLFEVETTYETLHILAKEEWEARDKVNEYLRQKYFGGQPASINGSIILLSESNPNRSAKKLIT